MTEKTMEMNKNLIRDYLFETKRPGIDELFAAMEAGGFFEAPCSTNYHLAEFGGLAKHSLNVFFVMEKLVDGEAEIPRDSLILCSLLHDLGKMGDHGEPNYIKAPLLKSGKEPAKPFITNPGLIYEEHEIRSLLIAERHIELNAEEESAILHHNGLFGKLDSSFGNHNYDSSKLAFWLHTADMYASRFVEVEGDE